MKKILLYGAGNFCRILGKHFTAHDVTIYDDDIEKHGAYIGDKKIVNLIEKSFDEIYITVAQLSLREIKNIFIKLNPYSKNIYVPQSFDKILKNDKPLIENFIKYEDYIASIKLPIFMNGRKVLVTGAGGSIGSVVCEILDEVGAEIWCLDSSEVALFNLKVRLNKKLNTILDDLSDKEKLVEILSNNGICTIIHAAATKHIDLAEENKDYTFVNNVSRYRNLLYACRSSNQVIDIVNISTDKAVEPSTFMGKTKLFNELTSLYHNKKFNMQIRNVRFGNVIGSSGSVIPVFQKQIRANATVTITDTRMERYFMTIEQAAALAINSIENASLGTYILEMGDPIRIINLAKRLHYLSNIPKKLEFKKIGVRSGEKLTELLFEARDCVELVNEYYYLSHQDKKYNMVDINDIDNPADLEKFLAERYLAE